MRKLLYAGVVAVCLSALAGHARQGGDFGLGVQLGEPSGLSGKLWLGRENAVDMLLGFSARHDWVFFKGDYLWHAYPFRVPKGQLPVHFGPGAMVSISDNAAIGLEFAFGISYLFPNAPLDAYLSIAPGAWIVPETDGDVNVGIGARFYF